MWQVYFKEILELTRDKKTLIFTVVLPTLVIPIFILGIGFLAADLIIEAEEEVLDYTVIGKDEYPELIARLAEDESINYIELSQSEIVEESIQQEKIRFAIEIEQGAQEKLASHSSLAINLIYNDASPLSKVIYRRVKQHIDHLNKEQLLLRITRLTQSNLDQMQVEAFIEPVRLKKQTTAEQRESAGETLGSIIPYILMLIALTGAMYPAIDIGAGEKERGTLETLLLTPVSRFKIVIAKFLVLVTTSITAVFLSLLSFIVWVGVLSSQFLHGLIPNFSLDSFSGSSELPGSIYDIGLILVLLLLTAAIFASLLLSLSIYARTFKEAQNYMSPLMMLLVFPIMIVILPGVELDWLWASVPITNVALAIKELIKGTIDYSMLLVIFASTAIVATFLLYLCSWWFQREQVLFRN